MCVRTIGVHDPNIASRKKLIWEPLGETAASQPSSINFCGLPPRIESLQIKRACSFISDHSTKTRSVLSGNQLSGLGSLNSLGNANRRTSAVSIWRMYISPGVSYASYLPSGEITAQTIGASDELVVIRFSIAGCGERILTRVTITPARATTARAISRKYHRRYFLDGVERPPTCVSGCSGGAGTLAGGVAAFTFSQLRITSGFVHRREETVTSLSRRFTKVGMVGVIAERLANLPNSRVKPYIEVNEVSAGHSFCCNSSRVTTVPAFARSSTSTRKGCSCNLMRRPFLRSSPSRSESSNGPKRKTTLARDAVEPIASSSEET